MTDLHTPSVLLIENSRMSQLIAKFFFIGLGCDLRIATTAWEGLQKTNSNHYDLILVSIALPDIDGCAASSMIRNNSRCCSDTPIIALSKKVDRQLCEKAYQVGINDCYMLPLTEQNCQAIIDEHIIPGDFCAAEQQ